MELNLADNLPSLANFPDVRRSIYYTKNVGKIRKFEDDFGLSVDTVYAMEQTHSNGVSIIGSNYDQCQWTESNKVCWIRGVDALIRDVRLVTGSEALLIRTADCVPLIVCFGYYVAVIHAGWRGLACEIITEVFKHLIRLNDNELELSFSEIQVYVGACARRYEVGREVIDSIKSAVYNPITVSESDELLVGKFLLDLVATARKEIELVISDLRNPCLVKFTCNLDCTISDKEYASFRRDGVKDSNITCIVVTNQCS